MLRPDPNAVVSLAYGTTTNSPLNDYQLTTNSLLRNAGTTNGIINLNLPGWTTNSEGKIDLGAYQH
jgi:hypothetical protein